ncbi:hypothetical protein C9427_16445 [Mesorhizobium helmanticense]|uniref:Propionyl-coenzyme A carboxylase alpha polypeptide n=1 Tax=Mesorhizobium helmanticense TaxID=1776423 RepID=A0A2T4IVI8_9HYPH|nr:hypothetical protein C9427_16445 [Mesorhizobium helmanticense]
MKEEAPPKNLPISPLEGEMSGRTEGVFKRQDFGISRLNSAANRPHACGAPYSPAMPRRYQDRSAAARIR